MIDLRLDDPVGVQRYILPQARNGIGGIDDSFSNFGLERRFGRMRTSFPGDSDFEFPYNCLERVSAIGHHLLSDFHAPLTYEVLSFANMPFFCS